MSQNETLLALHESEANSKDADTTQVADLADQVGRVTVSDSSAAEDATASSDAASGGADATPGQAAKET